jgi:hypothetical protein
LNNQPNIVLIVTPLQHQHKTIKYQNGVFGETLLLDTILGVYLVRFEDCQRERYDTLYMREKCFGWNNVLAVGDKNRFFFQKKKKNTRGSVSGEAVCLVLLHYYY